jgi:hypothetical protein
MAVAAQAETLRMATYQAELTRRGPGLLLRDIQSGEDPQIEAVIKVIAGVGPDILLLNGFDHDLDMIALGAFAARLAEAGQVYDHFLAPPQNSGLMTAIDLDGDGRLGTPEDAQGYGRFAGARAMVLLSRHPLTLEQDHTGFLWADLPSGRMPPAATEVRAIQRLSSTAHWVVRVDMPQDRALRVLAWAATPPLFGTGDRNLLRNHDETAFWLALLQGTLPGSAPPIEPFVVMGLANIDPHFGAGDKAAITELLAHPALGTGPQKATFHGRSQSLRLSYLLPSSGIGLIGAGTVDDDPDEAMGLAPEVISSASRHRLIWADLSLP